MTSIINTLSDLIKTLVDSFRLSTLLPALFFVLLNRLFLFRYLENSPAFKELTSQQTWDEPLIIFLLAYLLGYLLNEIEVPIVRLYEGYPWQHSFLGSVLIGWKRGHLDQLEEEIKELVKTRRDYEHLSPESKETISQIKAGIQRRRSIIDHEFPPDKTGLLPTQAGNIMAKFEAYPGTHYGMDSVTYWPRIYTILANEGYLPYISQARSGVDFLLNISLLLVLFGLECILLRILLLPHIGWSLPVVAFLLAYIFYKAAISSVYNWGGLIAASFDLFRYQLAQALGLKPAGDFKEEKRRWQGLTQFWHRNLHFDGFNNSEDSWPVVSSRKEQEGGG
jgi:hypothetical protein